MPVAIDPSVLPAPGNQRVLVAVLPSPADLVLADEQGWYRVPLRHAPQQMGADYIAFYQTGAFLRAARWQVATFAAVQRVALTTRGALLPDQAGHPRAHEPYYRVDIGPLWYLPAPIPSRRLRRITFIPTTLSRLLAAREINDLWDKSHAQDRLWSALLQAGPDVEGLSPWDSLTETLETDEPW